MTGCHVIFKSVYTFVNQFLELFSHFFVKCEHVMIFQELAVETEALGGAIPPSLTAAIGARYGNLNRKKW